MSCTKIPISLKVYQFLLLLSQNPLVAAMEQRQWKLVPALVLNYQMILGKKGQE